MNSDLVELKKYYENLIINNIDNEEKLFAIPTLNFRLIVDKLSSNSIAIDLGYGAGNYTSYLLGKNFKVIAVDIVDGKFLIKNNKQYLKDGNLIVIESDMNNFKIFNRIDLVVCINVLHYLSRKSVESHLKNFVKYTSYNGYHYIVMFTDISRIDKFGKNKQFKNEAKYSTEDFLLLINKIYKNWKLNITKKKYAEKDKNGNIYFEAQQIEIIAKNGK